MDGGGSAGGSDREDLTLGSSLSEERARARTDQAIGTEEGAIEVADEEIVNHGAIPRGRNRQEGGR